jgi:hypothetical protein
MKGVCAVILSLLLATIASAQDRRLAPPMLQYAAKFVCGAPKAGTANANVAASGRYFTAINVHNPSAWETVSFVKKFAVGLPQEEVGPVSRFVDVRLRPDDVLQIDCGNIRKHLGLNVATFVEGFAVIETRDELDVVSVYTAANGPAYEVSSIETERVPYRVMQGCPAQTTDISTGGSAVWNVTVDPSSGSTPRPASVMTPPHPWAIPGVVTFVSYSTAGSSLNPFSQATWTYEMRFCVCPLQSLQSAQPQLNMTMIGADDKAQVYLNLMPIGPLVIAQPSAGPATLINSAAAGNFHLGLNVLSVEVTDMASGGTGFGLSGTITGTVPCP